MKENNGQRTISKRVQNPVCGRFSQQTSVIAFEHATVYLPRVPSSHSARVTIYFCQQDLVGGHWIGSNVATGAIVNTNIVRNVLVPKWSSVSSLVQRARARNMCCVHLLDEDQKNINLRCVGQMILPTNKLNNIPTYDS